MKLLSIMACYRELRKRGHTISRNDLYRMKANGILRMVGNKTSPEAVIAMDDNCGGKPFFANINYEPA